MPGSSRLFLDYAESAEPLAPFYSTAAAGKGWICEGRKLSAEHRARLADLLAAQNAAFGGGELTARNINRLRNGASAVVTGQQVALFGGPLYTLLKAATAIARAREATEAGFDTVPIFWLASEDHDFAEIAHVDLPVRDGLQSVAIGPAPEA
ncbi:MAG TPA: bacillithiol biosynthesis BshC, partial [Bryobacteraceae bacterium]|nr:bacillithiol biosynthesis BshC [Bryobacteraceae bacterium]